MDTADVAQRLLPLDLLKPVPDDLREPLARTITEVCEYFETGAGERVLEEGHLGFACGYVMLSGEAEIERNGDGRVSVQSGCPGCPPGEPLRVPAA